MTIRFLHAADIHLGYLQYNCVERYNDFARAFGHLADDALRRRVDFLLIAGDLFHQRNVEPLTLYQATLVLQRLRDARIPVIAVEGNHEKSYSQDRFSWLDYLAESGLITLLSVGLQGDQARLDPCADQLGSYIDLPGGVRVVGMQYYGGSTGLMLERLTQALAKLPGPRPPYTVLMLHAGLQGILDGYAATLTRAQLEPLRPYVDYLALGHIHKPYSQDGWIYNPGSLETNSVSEADWDERGYLAVEATPNDQTAHRVTTVRCPRRAFERLTFSVDAYDTPEALLSQLEAYLQRHATPAVRERAPVVQLQLVGGLSFDAQALDKARIEALVRAAFDPLVYLFKDLTAPSAFEITPDEMEDREHLERFVLRELVERDVRYRQDSEAWASLALRLKQLALDGGSPEGVIAEMRAFRRFLPTSFTESEPC